MEPKVFLNGKTRSARGFSISELKKANIDLGKAKRMGIRIDKRRKTLYDENVKLLANRREPKKKGRDKPPAKRTKKGKEKKIVNSTSEKKTSSPTNSS
jgi:hypothetical protein